MTLVTLGAVFESGNVWDIAKSYIRSPFNSGQDSTVYDSQVGPQEYQSEGYQHTGSAENGSASSYHDLL